MDCFQRCLISQHLLNLTCTKHCLCLSVLSDQSNSYSVILNDVYVMRGGTAVFRCDIYPTYIRSYIRVVRWTKGTKSVSSGKA